MNNNIIEDNQEFNKKLSIENDMERLKTMLESKISIKTKSENNDKDKALKALDNLKKNKGSLSEIVSMLHKNHSKNSKIMKIIEDIIDNED